MFRHYLILFLVSTQLTACADIAVLTAVELIVSNQGNKNEPTRTNFRENSSIK